MHGMEGGGTSQPGRGKYTVLYTSGSQMLKLWDPLFKWHTTAMTTIGIYLAFQD